MWDNKVVQGDMYPNRIAGEMVPNAVARIAQFRAEEPAPFD